MSEYENEPVRGLPGFLPEGEHILWQAAPDWKAMAANALHIRLTAAYFAMIVVWAVVSGDNRTAIAVATLGAAVIALMAAFAWGVGRTTLYTLTNRRIVMRVGVALNKCINLPLTEIESANLKILGNGHGSIVLSLKGEPRLGYLMLWPHARSLRVMRPQPALRAIPDARTAAQLLFQATQQVQAVAPAEAQSRPMADRPIKEPNWVGATA
jgi:Bacterial PH domain